MNYKWFLFLILLLPSCSRQPERFTVDVLNSYTPIKNQGQSQTCWAYAMLAAIETEHIMKGDSVELSVAWVERMMEQDPQAPPSKRAVAPTLITMIESYGLVPYYAMPTTDDLPPRWAFMYGAQYTPLEFAHSVCAPNEYVAIGTSEVHPAYAHYEMESPDNWEHCRLLNVPRDSLLAITEQAVRNHHGACWEGDITESGFDWKRGVAKMALASRLFHSAPPADNHCMAIVGIARDEEGQPYFIMKNSWGTDNAYGGMLYMSFPYFQAHTLAVVLPRECLYHDLCTFAP